MKIIYKILITAILAIIISKLIPGIIIANITTAILVAIVLGLLNLFVKPLIILFTLPITIFSLGLFLLVINAIMIIVCDQIVGGFEVVSFWTAFLFSITLSLSQSVIFAVSGINKTDKKK